MKLLSSPTPALEPKGRCSRFFTSWITTPYTGPRENVPSRAGRSGDVQLHKAGDQGNGKLHELQHRGHGAEHGGYRQAMGSFACLRHKKKTLLLIKSKTPGKTCLPRCTHQKKHCDNAVHAFSHPDYTVGTGIAPVPAAAAARRLSLPVGNFAPPRRQLFGCFLLLVYTRCRQNATGKCRLF